MSREYEPLAARGVRWQRSGARDQMAARRGTDHLGSRLDLALLQSS
jgi:hypothetical protein